MISENELIEKMRVGLAGLLHFPLFILWEREEIRNSSLFWDFSMKSFKNSKGNGLDFLVTFCPTESIIRELSRDERILGLGGLWKIFALATGLPVVITDGKEIIYPNTPNGLTNKFGQAWFIGVSDEKKKWILKFQDSGSEIKTNPLKIGKVNARKLLCDKETYQKENTLVFEARKIIQSWGYQFSADIVEDEIEDGVQLLLERGERLSGLKEIQEATNIVVPMDDEIKDGIFPDNPYT